MRREEEAVFPSSLNSMWQSIQQEMDFTDHESSKDPMADATNTTPWTSWHRPEASFMSEHDDLFGYPMGEALCVNPIEVEGKMSSYNVNKVGKKRNVKNLKLNTSLRIASKESNNLTAPKNTSATPTEPHRGGIIKNNKKMSNSLDNLEHVVESGVNNLDTLDTPVVEEALAFDASDSTFNNFDLLDFVTNPHLPVDDPQFLSLLHCDPIDSSSSVSSQSANNTLNVNHIGKKANNSSKKVKIPKNGSSKKNLVGNNKSNGKVGKRKREVPIKPLPQVSQEEVGELREENLDDRTEEKAELPEPTLITCIVQPLVSKDQLTRNDHAYTTTSSSSKKSPLAKKMPSASGTISSSTAKYRRMRDLNNEASKRCRANRKRKFEELLTELESEQERNEMLRAKAQKLEKDVSRFKEAFLKRVANQASSGK